MQRDDVTSIDSWPEVDAFLVLSRYYALVRFSELISTRVDTEGYAVEGDRDQIFDNVMELRKSAARQAASYGYIVEVTNDSQIGSGNEQVDQEGGNTSNWRRDVWKTDYIDPVPFAYPMEL